LVWSAGPGAVRLGGIGIASEFCYDLAIFVQQFPIKIARCRPLPGAIVIWV
jgi:hypothetical protein